MEGDYYKGSAEQTAQDVSLRQLQRVGGGNGRNLSAPTTPPAGPILMAIGEQEQVIQLLHGAINELQARLELVLGPTAPSNSGNGAISERSSHVFDRVNDNTRYIRLACDRIAELMQRLQL